MILITGGARSGKSMFAEKLAKEKGNKILYIATAIAFDEEMKIRIKKHKEVRPATWTTYEGYSNLKTVIYKNEGIYSCILLDCVTIMLTNLMIDFIGRKDAGEIDFLELEKMILQEIEELLEACQKTNAPMIFVTNEIGMGIVPESQISRHFRDIAGKVNQRIAKEAQKVYFVVSGIPVCIKGEKK